MKKVIGVSLGASSRDHSVVVDVLGEPIQAARYGCDGDLKLMKQRLIEADQDPTVNAIGLGGVAVGFNVAGKFYTFREIKKLVKVVENTPVLDGTGLKQAVEGRVVPFMTDVLGMQIEGKNTLIMCAIDRWGLAEAFTVAGAHCVYGDLLYALDIKKMMNSIDSVKVLAKIIMPLVTLLPFSFVYDSAADATTKSKRDAYTDKLIEENDYLVGDYKYIIKYLPDDLKGKTVVTNTTTPADIELLRKHNVGLVIATTPEFDGRTFGTNVLEALLCAYRDGEKPLSFDEYYELIQEAKFYPAVFDFRDENFGT